MELDSDGSASEWNVRRSQKCGGRQKIAGLKFELLRGSSKSKLGVRVPIQDESRQKTTYGGSDV